MNSNVMAARILLQDAEFDLAKELLEAEENDAQALYYLSLLHRYYNKYNDEFDAITKALKLDPSNAYLQERSAWYKNSLQTDLCPRQPLHLPAEPHKLPSKEILAQMCFVTSGYNDPTYFKLLIQLIESIKATLYYNQAPICIIDGGLTDEQKQTLTTTFDNLTIKDPAWDLDMPADTDLDVKTGLAQAFMDQHFPGYRFYMWIANDAWVQDENSIHNFLYQAQLHGAGLVLKDHAKVWTEEGSWPTINAEHKIYPPSWDSFLNKRQQYTCGAFCIDATTNFFPLWRKALTEVNAEYGYQLGLERVAFVYAMHKLYTINPISPLDHTHCFTYYSEGLPVLGVASGVLCLPSTLGPLGIIYFEDERFIAKHPLLPMFQAKEPLSPEWCAINHRFFFKILKKSQSSNRRPDTIEIDGVKTTVASYHYHTWTAQDKAQILVWLQEPLF